MPQLSTIYVDFDGRMARLNQKVRDAENRTKGASQRMTGSFDKVSSALVKLGAGIYAAQKAFGFLSDSYNLYLEQARSEAKVEQAIRRTGGAAGYTADELKRMASRLQDITGIGDEKILNDVTAQLLTFGSVAGDAFERAQKAALDIATVVGTDLKSVTIQLGKVLEDPVGLMSSLSRSGIIFSETQEKVIKDLAKQGKLQEAQLMILDEIDKLYGGQAQAINEATGGIQNMEAAWGDMKESIGAAFAPLLNEIFPAVTKALKVITGTWSEFLEEMKDSTVPEAAKAWKDFYKEATPEDLDKRIGEINTKMAELNAQLILGKSKENLFMGIDVEKVGNDLRSLKSELWGINSLISGKDIGGDKPTFNPVIPQGKEKATAEVKEFVGMAWEEQQNYFDALGQMYDDYLSQYRNSEIEALQEIADLRAQRIEETKEWQMQADQEAREAAAAQAAMFHEQELSAVSQLGNAMQNAFDVDGNKGITVLNQMLQLAIQIATTMKAINAGTTSATAGGLGIFGGVLGLFSGLFRASGGPVSNNTPYIVGERGPELFVPSSNGMIVPNNVINNTYGFSDANMVNAIKGIYGRIESLNITVMNAVLSRPPQVINLDGRTVATITQSNLNTLEREGVNKDAL